MHKTPIHRFSLTFIFADRPYVVRFDLHPGNGNMKCKLTSFTILRNQNYHNCLNTIQTLCKTVKISLLHHQPVSYRINLHMSSWLSIRKSAKFNKLLISMACLCFRTTRCVRMFLSICSMFPLAFVAVWLQGHWWDFISRNYVVWPTVFLPCLYFHHLTHPHSRFTRQYLNLICIFWTSFSYKESNKLCRLFQDGRMMVYCRAASYHPINVYWNIEKVYVCSSTSCFHLDGIVSCRESSTGLSKCTDIQSSRELVRC